jgi:hypothetical protein
MQQSPKRCCLHCPHTHQIAAGVSGVVTAGQAVIYPWRAQKKRKMPGMDRHGLARSQLFPYVL